MGDSIASLLCIPKFYAECKVFSAKRKNLRIAKKLFEGKKSVWLIRRLQTGFEQALGLL